MAVSTAIFNQDVQNPIAYAQDIVAKQKEQELETNKLAAKRSQANAKEIGEMMEVGDDWGVKFREPLTNRLNGFRDKIRQYAAGGGDATNPAFQQWYAQGKTELLSDAQKGKYIEDYMADAREVVKNDPYRHLKTWEDSFYKQFQYEDGSWADPSDIDLEQMEKSQNNMAGYLVDKAAKDFVKASPDEVMQKINQQQLKFGLVATSLEETKSKLYVVEDGQIKIDPTTGIPMINMTDEWVGAWNQDPDRQRWLENTMQSVMEENEIKAEYGSPEYVDLQKQILDPVLRPYAVYEQSQKGFSVRNPKETTDRPSGLTQKRFDNAMKFKEQVTQTVEGNTEFLKQGGKIKKVERARGADLSGLPKSYRFNKFVEEIDDNAMYDVLYNSKGEVVDIIDYANMDDAREKIGGLMRFQSRPTAAELDVTGAFYPKGSNQADYQEAGWLRFNPSKFEPTGEETQTRNIKDIKANVSNDTEGTAALNQSAENGGIVGLSYTEDGKTKTVTKVEGRTGVQQGTQKITFDNGDTMLIGGNSSANNDIIDKLVKGGKGTAKTTKITVPENVNKQDSTTAAGLGDIYGTK